MKITFYAYSTVSEEEINKLLARPKFINFFKMLQLICDALPEDKIIFPTNWLITSIDNSVSSGAPRIDVEHGNHYDSRAVDIVPLTNELTIRLPIPLNRNLLLMDMFTAGYKLFPGATLPMTAFESDHLHIDVNHPTGIYRLKKVRSYFDQMFYAVSNVLGNGFIKSAIDDGVIIKVY